jgi:hypothetical protein
MVAPSELDRNTVVRVSPTGQLLFDIDADNIELAGLGPSERARLLAAVGLGTGYVVLQLGLAHVDDALPPALAWVRELGKRFATRLCAEPILDEQRERSAPAATDTELEALRQAVPPLLGAEYVSVEVLRAWWSAAADAYVTQLRALGGTLQAWLGSYGSAWHVVGKVCFHLAENPNDPELPFAFLATYVTRATAKSAVAHAPLSRALAASSASADTALLLSLLVPVQRAAEHSDLVRGLLDSGDLYHPLAWSPAEAYRFLREVPALEAAGVVVRVPDWWRSRRPPRPQVQVTVGGKAPGQGSLGVDAMLDFNVDVTLEGDVLTKAELRALLQQQQGLALVRGKWVEIDRDKLRDVLEHWKGVQREAGKDGLSFLAGMRLLAGAQLTERDAPDEATTHWSRVEAGTWLGQTLASLREPDALAATDLGAALRTELRAYQQTGVNWLWFAASLRLGVCLADDMGLGKTVQVLALMLMFQRTAQKKGAPARPPHLLVVPASLLGNWQAEAERFAPSLRMLVAHVSALPAKELAALPASRLADVDVVLTTYGTTVRLPWLAQRDWSLLVLDEAQAIKNPGTRQTRAIKALRAQSRVALSGTPIENRLGDLW